METFQKSLSGNHYIDFMDTQICNHLEAEPIVNANYGRFREKTFWKDATCFIIFQVLAYSMQKIKIKLVTSCT